MVDSLIGCEGPSPFIVTLGAWHNQQDDKKLQGEASMKHETLDKEQL